MAEYEGVLSEIFNKTTCNDITNMRGDNYERKSKRKKAERVKI